MRIMGLDIGTKNIGVAVSDESGTIAQGRECVLRTTDEKAVDRIKEMAKEYGVSEIVVGYPLNMDGSAGERAKDSECFAALLRGRTACRIELWDERLSTKEAESIMIAGDVSRKKRKRSVDKLAAQLILQSYLDSREKN